MNILNLSVSSRTASLLGLLLLLGACSSMVKKEDVSVVDKRAVERWNLLIATKPDKAYDYLSPGYQKTQTREAYAAQMGNRPVHWKKVSFLGKDCSEDVCHVRLLVDFTVNVSVGMGREASSVDVIKEDWLNIDGHWYFLPPALGGTTPK
jgi:hypothetical protein